MIVTLKREDSNWPDIAMGQPYVVLGIEADALRILNDQGRPYLYPREIFEILDSREPSDWVTELGDENERYAYPKALNEVGFFEDYFDGRPEVIATFWRVLNRRLSEAA